MSPRLDNGDDGVRLSHRVEAVAVGLAVSEAVTNVAEHAYPDVPAGPVDVAADLEDGCVEVVVLDAGAGLPDRPARPGPGLTLISASTTKFEIRDGPLRGVEVWMRFDVRR